MYKKRIKSHTCPNCGCEFGDDLSYINYCPECGQENNNPRVSLQRHIIESIRNFTNFDSKFWHSVRTLLFSPGTITKDYLENKRDRYTSPVRMLFIVAALSISVSILVNKSFIKSSGDNEFISDTLSFSQKFDTENDSIKYNFTDFPLSLLVSDREVSVKELRELKQISGDSVSNWLVIHGYSNNILTRLIAHNAKREISSDMTWEQSAKFAGSINNILIFLLIPISSFVFYLVFFKRDRMYYDVFIFTIHSFIALIFFNMIFFTVINIWNIWGRSALYQDFTYFVLFAFILNIIPSAKKVFNYKWLTVVIRMILAMVVLLFISIILQRILLTYY